MLTAKELERLDAVEGSKTMAKVMWQSASANPNATAVCMVVMRSKHGAVDKYGHPLTEDQRLAVVIEQNAEEIRKYSDGDVYLRADNWKVYWRYITILQKASDKPSEADCPRWSACAGPSSVAAWTIFRQKNVRG